MKKAIKRDRTRTIGEDNQNPSGAKHGKRRSRRRDGRSSKRKLPNFLANLEKLGYTELEGRTFLKQFAHDAVL